MKTIGSNRIERRRQITLAWYAGQLGFGPETECFSLGLALFLTRGKADLGRLTVDVSLYVVERTDTIEGFPRDLGFVRCLDYRGSPVANAPSRQLL